VIKIYRRYNPGKAPSSPNNQPPPPQKQQILRETAPPKPVSKPPDKSAPNVNREADSQKSMHHQSEPKRKTTENPWHSHKASPYNGKNAFNNAVHGFLPPHLYNRETKKLLGLFTAEDLLLIALILIFSENDENTDPFTVLALIYILLSDYIDFPDFEF